MLLSSAPAPLKCPSGLPKCPLVTQSPSPSDSQVSVNALWLAQVPPKCSCDDRRWARVPAGCLKSRPVCHGVLGLTQLFSGQPKCPPISPSALWSVWMSSGWGKCVLVDCECSLVTLSALRSAEVTYGRPKWSPGQPMCHMVTLSFSWSANMSLKRSLVGHRCLLVTASVICCPNAALLRPLEHLCTPPRRTKTPLP